MFIFKSVVFALLVCFPSTSFASQLSILDLEINHQETGEFLYRLDVRAELSSQGALTQFSASIRGEEFTYSVSDVKSNKGVWVKYKKVKMAHIQLLNPDAFGSGWLRVTLAPARLSSSFPDSYKVIDLYLHRSKKNQGWSVLYRDNTGFRMLRSAQLFLNKDPREMSLISLLANPPKATQLQMDYFQCTHRVTVAETLGKFGLKDLIQVLGCRENLSEPNTLVSLLLGLSEFHSSGVTWDKSSGPSEALRLVKQLKEQYVDFSKPGVLPESYINQLYTYLIRFGADEVYDYLLDLNISIPDQEVAYMVALLNTIQFDKATKTFWFPRHRMQLLERIRRDLVDKGLGGQIMSVEVFFIYVEIGYNNSVEVYDLKEPELYDSLLINLIQALEQDGRLQIDSENDASMILSNWMSYDGFSFEMYQHYTEVLKDKFIYRN